MCEVRLEGREGPDHVEQYRLLRSLCPIGNEKPFHDFKQKVSQSDLYGEEITLSASQNVYWRGSRQS